MSDAFDQTGLPQMISNKDSEIKARYALAVLRVARAADRETAARLVQGLARDFPHPESGGKLLRFTSNSSKHLAEGLRASTVAPSSWQAAHRCCVQMAQRRGKKLNQTTC
jgi:hypothetical protein